MIDPTIQTDEQARWLDPALALLRARTPAEALLELETLLEAEDDDRRPAARRTLARLSEFPAFRAALFAALRARAR